MPPVDEASRRRAPFTGGVPVLLADGQAWTFPRPLLGLMPEVGSDGKVRFGENLRFNFGEAYDALVDAFAESEDWRAESEALLALALDLLGRNYDLSGLALGEILPRLLNDEGNADMWRAVAEVAVGKAPKPIPVG